MTVEDSGVFLIRIAVKMVNGMAARVIRVEPKAAGRNVGICGRGHAEVSIAALNEFSVVHANQAVQEREFAGGEQLPQGRIVPVQAKQRATCD